MHIPLRSREALTHILKSGTSWPCCECLSLFFRYSVSPVFHPVLRLQRRALPGPAVNASASFTVVFGSFFLPRCSFCVAPYRSCAWLPYYCLLRSCVVSSSCRLQRLLFQCPNARRASVWTGGCRDAAFCSSRCLPLSSLSSLLLACEGVTPLFGCLCVRDVSCVPFDGPCDCDL